MECYPTADCTKDQAAQARPSNNTTNRTCAYLLFFTSSNTYPLAFGVLTTEPPTDTSCPPTNTPPTALYLAALSSPLQIHAPPSRKVTAVRKPALVQRTGGWGYSCCSNVRGDEKPRAKESAGRRWGTAPQGEETMKETTTASGRAGESARPISRGS